MPVTTGIYYFVWYNERRWKEAPFSGAPLLGRYDSSDPFVISWQLDLIRHCGIDYVIFVLVPEDDWAFGTVGRAIETALEYLRGTGMQWSFLLDAKSGPASAVTDEGGEIAKLAAMYRCVGERGWTDGLVRGPSGRPLLFVYAPGYGDALSMAEEIAAEYEWRMPIFLPESHWDALVDVRRVIPPRYLEQVRQRLEGRDTRRTPLVDLLAALGYVSFWGESVRTCAGIAPVIPGYDDSLLNRVPQLAPQVSRRDGETLRRQFEAAVRTRPQHIIVYGWNEYYESTYIEPSRDFGMSYVELLRSLIAGLGRVPTGEPAIETVSHPASRRRGPLRLVRRWWGIGKGPTASM